MTTSKPLPADPVLMEIADYVIGYKVTREAVYKIAAHCLLDALACAFYALPTQECAKLLGPVAAGTRVPNGARVPGTHYELDSIKAAFDIGTAIRWLDYNDSWYAAEATHLMGGSRQEIINALSNAWLDGISARLYRIEGHMGWRKSWASGDATSRGVMHAWMALRGEMGYPRALSAPVWGFCDAVLRGKPIVLARPLDSYIVENILFKPGFPGQIHIQTAGECAMKLHPLVKERLADIKAVHIRTHQRAFETASKEGPLRNAADRDHCLQYVVAFMLVHGKLVPSDFEEDAAADPRLDVLRSKMTVSVDKNFTRDFVDLRTRTNSNAVSIEFRDGTRTQEVRIDFPLGHPRRRREGLRAVEEKFRRSLIQTFATKRQRQILAACGDLRRLRDMPFAEFMALFVK